MKYRTLFLLSALLLPGCGFSGDSLDSLHYPVVIDSDITPTKLEAIWSRLQFGHYPSREIVGSRFKNVEYYAYDKYDVLEDANLYAKLMKAEWKDNAVSIDGVNYIRALEPDTPSSSQHYTYDNPGHKYHYFECESITWRVLSLTSGRATLIADKALDCFPYHNDDSGKSWQDSSLRQYLNIDFYNKAFTSQEHLAIRSHVSYETINHDYDVSTGKTCEDNVYLLDQDEMFASNKAASYGFYAGSGYDDPAKRFKSTTYAKFKGAWYSPVEGYRGNCFHFMRTAGYKEGYVSYICDFGYIYSRGTSADCFDAGIVPVIDVDLMEMDWLTVEDRYSSEMMQIITKEGSGEEVLGRGQWESVEYGEYPQDEIKNTDPEYDALKAASWVNDEIEIEGNRYRRIGDRYFKYQPISWRILEKEGDFALLFANSGLDCHPYHDTLVNTNWADSKIRDYLNRDFLNMAFPNPAALREKYLANRPNYYFGTHSGLDTTDKVFLLAEEDIFGEEASRKHGFAPSDATNDVGRRIAPTDYAKAKGAWVSKDGQGFYSLRTNGYSGANAVYVGELGDVYNRGIPLTCSDMTLAPAIWVDLSTLSSL